MKRSINRRKESNKIVNYMASLAILDGSISPYTKSEMFKVKGLICQKNKDNGLALVYFKRALEYYDKIGVKKRVLKLTANINK